MSLLQPQTPPLRRLVLIAALVTLALATLTPAAHAQSAFLRGDANVDGVHNIADAAFELAALFVTGSPQPTCEDAADVNDDGTFDVADPVFALNALFVPGSPVLPPPTGSCGFDATPSGLTCLDFTACSPPSDLSYGVTAVTFGVGESITPLVPTASGSPITSFTVDPLLPTGITFDPATGAIRGTPATVSANAIYTIEGTNALGSTATDLAVAVINPQPPTFLEYPNADLLLFVGTPLAPQIPAIDGGPNFDFAIDPALPNGLSIDASNGAIGGLPTEPTGVIEYTVTAMNSGGSVSSTIALEISSALITSISSAELCPGDVITLSTIGAGSDAEFNRVHFTDTDGAVRIPGRVIDVVDTGFDPVTSLPTADLSVVVPTGVRTGFVTLSVYDPTTGVTARAPSSIPVVGCPQLFGFVNGPEGDPFLNLSAAGVVEATEFQLYGLNLIDVVTEIDMEGPNGFAASFDVISGGAPAPEYTLPDGIDIVTVLFTAPTPTAVACDPMYVEITPRSSTSPSFDATASTILVPLRTVLASGDFADMQASISGCLLPSGVRSGIVSIRANLVMEPARARYDWIPEWFDATQPSGSEWQPCTGVDVGEGLAAIPGVPAMTSEFGSLIGGGRSQTFRWDTTVDLPNTRVATRLRFRLENEEPDLGSCSGFPASGRRFETHAIAIDNTGGSAGPIIEEFNDRAFVDLPATNAAWNVGNSGVLSRGDAASPALPWGTGSVDVFLVAGNTYELRTDDGSIVDVTSGSTVILPADGTPSFDCRTFFMDPGAEVVFVGSNPVIIRCSGTGDPTDVVADLAGSLDLNGAPGEPWVSGQVSLGGAGGPGGGDGGNGGVIVLDPATEEILEELPATRGGNNGGGPGRSLTFVLDSIATAPKAGPGGGGGCTTQGQDAITTWPSVFPAAELGRGGPRRVTDGIFTPVGGSGGGGGGATLFRQSALAPAIVREGASGGGGGGALWLVVDGSVRIAGVIVAEGGEGSVATAHSGPGGGGSGGTIRLSATGNVEIAAGALLSADRGLGGSVFMNSSGGFGSVGLIRLEAGLAVAVDPTADVGPVSSVGFFRGTTMERHEARSQPYAVASDGVWSEAPTFGPPVIDYSVAPSSSIDAIVLYEGAPESTSRPGTPGVFRGSVDDPSLLPSDTSFIRHRWFLFSDRDTGETVEVDRIEIPFDL